MTDKIQLLIVDDHPIVRSGLRSLLMAESDIEVVGEATDGKEAIEQTDIIFFFVTTIVSVLMMAHFGFLNGIRRLLANIFSPKDNQFTPPN